MADSTTSTKQLCLVGRSGPAFSLGEIPASHAILDSAGVPRKLSGEAMTLPERISYLAGMLVSARIASVQKQIFILSKSDCEKFIPEEYQKVRVSS